MLSLPDPVRRYHGCTISTCRDAQSDVRSVAVRDRSFVISLTEGRAVRAHRTVEQSRFIGQAGKVVGTYELGWDTSLELPQLKCQDIAGLGAPGRKVEHHSERRPFLLSLR